MSKVIIVGSGIAALASAIRLRVKGYEVSVFERNAYPGGKLTVLERDGYRFDAGPSLFTMPHLVDELFQLAGKNPKDYFDYVKHDVSCHYFFEDGIDLKFYADFEQTKKEVEDKLNYSTAGLERYLKKSSYIYDKTHQAFLEQSLHKLGNYFTKAVLKCLLAAPKLQLFSTLHRANDKALKHPKLVQIFDRFATYNGSNPYQAPGILAIIPHLEHGFGTYFPTKGMHSITSSLVRLAEDLGVVFQYNEPVDEILYSQQNVKGIRTKNGDYFADLVFCNADVRFAYQRLLPKLKMPKKIQQQEPSSSALIFYWGVSAVFPQLDLHNIFFSRDYRGEFASIFEKGTVSDDPTIYLHRSCHLLKSDAPEGKEAWFVMVNVPSNDGQDWNAFQKACRENVIQKLNRLLNIDLERLIETEDFLDPIRIEQRTASYAGALYGPSSNKRTAAFFRHSNFSPINGLYFVGGSVHPGGGIPLCLLSAKIATENL